MTVEGDLVTVEGVGDSGGGTGDRVSLNTIPHRLRVEANFP